MNFIDLGGILLVGLWFVLSCRHIYRQKKAGRSCACGGCKTCTQCSSCHDMR